MTRLLKKCEIQKKALLRVDDESHGHVTSAVFGIAWPCRSAQITPCRQMNDDQLAELVAYLRRQFAPEKPAWTGVEAAISRIRQAKSR